ncbi:PQQ-binding-like beta-propeller repeat protein [Deinococcus pimensis]|uniref:outer membrane protein assembly factor BamB family protein n=1 Tax=Deinococcus pimensis TaxID=309888 RepID=UPI0004806ED0|nr:PQQ-binding-like beta-propeller repeat protein [Deinococcus pimensis]
MAEQRLTPRWAYPTHEGVSTLARVGDVVVTAVRRSQVAALDLRTGEERWRARHVNAAGWDLDVNSTHVVARGRDHLMALHLATGEVAWRRDVPSFSGWPRVHGDRVLVGGWRAYTPLQAFELHSGAPLWQREVTQAPLRTAVYTPLAAATVVTPDGRVTFLSLDNGRVLHEVSLPDLTSGQKTDWIPTGPLGTPGEALLLRGEGDRVYRLSGEDVRVEERSLGAVPFTRALRERAGEVFFQDSERALRVYDVARDTTVRLGWPQHNASWILPVTRVSDGSVVMGTSFGQLLRFSPQGGIIGAALVGRRVQTELHVEGDVVVFGTRDGSVIALPWRALR